MPRMDSNDFAWPVSRREASESEQTVQASKNVMKKNIIALTALALMAVVGNSSAQVNDDYSPFKVTGGGIYQHYVDVNPVSGLEWYPSDDEFGHFSISLNPDKKAGKKSPQAVIHVDGPVLREVWGGPLTIQDDWVACFPAPPYRPEDLKPGQFFLFVMHHPVLEDVQVWVFAHDNCTPGYNRTEDPNWSDWFVVVIEPLGGDGWPGTEDDLYVGMGIVVRGNIMDHR
jgi:hypothetical protein